MEYTDYCGMCGMALTVYEVSADIRGDFIVFNDKNIGKIQISLCEDCKNKIIAIVLGGIDEAAKRRNALEISDHPPRLIGKPRNKDDDEDGGVPAKI